jgi:hypothetical protein
MPNQPIESCGHTHGKMSIHILSPTFILLCQLIEHRFAPDDITNMTTVESMGLVDRSTILDVCIVTCWLGTVSIIGFRISFGCFFMLDFVNIS